MRMPDVQIDEGGTWHMLYNGTDPEQHYGPTGYATSADGVVEAIELEGSDHFLAVQWHPELLRHRPEQLGLFRDLVERSRRGPVS